MSEETQIVYLAEQYDSATGEVYPGRLKIGFTSRSVAARTSELSKTRSPVKSRCIAAWKVPNAQTVESYLHAALEDVRLDGEWFSDRQRVERTVRAYMAMHGQPLDLPEADSGAKGRSGSQQRSPRGYGRLDKARMADEFVTAARGWPFVSEVREPQKYHSVRGRIRDMFSFSVDPLTKDARRFKVHLFRLRLSPTERDLWSRNTADALGGEFHPANRGHKAHVVVVADSVHAIRRTLAKLADLEVTT